MQANWVKLIAMLGAFLMPISGLLFLVGFVIMLDTITGVCSKRIRSMAGHEKPICKS